METSEAIKRRRSIRGFSSKKVNKSLIKSIIEAGRLAPSTKNTQPWHFLVLTGESKDKLAEVAQKHFVEAAWIKDGSTRASCEILKQAPAVILVFNKGPRSGGEKKVTHNPKLLGAVIAETLSIGACIENMILKATSLGLGSLWMGDLTNAAEAINSHLKVKYDLIAGVAIGYPEYKIKPRQLLKPDIKFLK